jgi:hypothetical protein
MTLKTRLAELLQQIWHPGQELSGEAAARFARACAAVPVDVRLDWDAFRSGRVWVDATLSQGKLLREISRLEYYPPRDRTLDTLVVGKLPLVRLYRAVATTPEDTLMSAVFNSRAPSDAQWYDVDDMRCQLVKRLCDMMLPTQRVDNPDAAKRRVAFMELAFELLVDGRKTPLTWQAWAECLGMPLTVVVYSDPDQEETLDDFDRRQSPFSKANMTANLFKPLFTGSSVDQTALGKRLYLIERSRDRLWSLNVHIDSLVTQPKRVAMHAAEFDVWKNNASPTGSLGGEAVFQSTFIADEPTGVEVFWSVYNS